jgi:hypothetical protein
MVIRAVVFDIGGVLERMDPPGQWLEPWRERLALLAENVDAACRFGIHGVLHRSTPESIAEISLLLDR